MRRGQVNGREIGGTPLVGGLQPLRKLLVTLLTTTVLSHSQSVFQIEYSSSLTIPVYTRTLIITLHYTCCYDEIKGIETSKFVLMLIL